MIYFYILLHYLNKSYIATIGNTIIEASGWTIVVIIVGIIIGISLL